MVARALVVCVALFAACTYARPKLYDCNVLANTDAGTIRGLARRAENGAVYASFRGVPYAKQPTGELRFKTDVIYGRIMKSQGMSEECIHANIHVPIEALPQTRTLARGSQTLCHPGLTGKKNAERSLPILVFFHGGGFMSGSGDADLHGPEYLVSKNVIVITFNYRLNVFGFLSLDSKEIPGNQGLRDQVTLLRWVQRNARNFGGDPDNVTLMGQSAGATSVHLLTLSEATKDLYKRAYLMSGTAISGYYSPSPVFAQTVSQMFLLSLGINSTDTEYIHRQLIELPAEKINEAHSILLDQFGLNTFVPTVETYFPGITRVVDDYPEVLISKGRGKNVPLIIGFTDVECEVFRPRLEQIDIASKINDNPLLNVPVNIIYSTPPGMLPLIIKKIEQQYYNGTISLQGFIDYCTDVYYKYPALKLSETRSSPDAAPVFLYQFAYDGDNSVLREAHDLNYKGAAHIEDLTYVFRTNSMLGLQNPLQTEERDDQMKDWMTNFLTDFMHCSNPVCSKESAWPKVTPQRLQFQDIEQPIYRIGPLGFLCVGDEIIPGNAAVKDVVLALRWVHDNIVAFKGNPAKTVIAGQSLGAAMVEGITLSPMADGLYHGVILESGTILAPWAFNYNAKERAMMLEEIYSDDLDSSSALMDAKTEELVEISNKLAVPYFPFGICIENSLKREERLLSEAPVDLLNAKRVGKVPMIIGYNSNEAYIFASILKETKVSKSRMSILLPQELKFLNDREIKQIARQVGDMYFKSNISMSALLAYHRDAYFVNHIHRSVRLHASAHPVYYYQFSYSSDLGVQEEPMIKKMGAAHSDELAYLFSGRDLQGNDEVVQKNLLLLTMRRSRVKCACVSNLDGSAGCGVAPRMELQPATHWDHLLDATQEGPICPQHDEIFSQIIAPYRGMSEACIYGNVYVPTAALPDPQDSHENRFQSYGTSNLKKPGLRILVFIHGGAFQSGSADSDLNGPEYLVGEGIILITFNYRLNVFGFLSLNTPEIPGNAGLRDMVTFLRWVRRNARSFGGDPDDVTLMGQSRFYTASPINAKIVATLFLIQLGLNSTSPVDIHHQLVTIPLDRILKANSEVQYMTGFISFAPVIEAPFPGVTVILDDEPLELIKIGRCRKYPLMVQFTANECELFRQRLEYYQFTKRIEANPTILLSPSLVFNTLPQVSLNLARKTMRRYFKGKPTLDEYMNNCLDVLFRYSTFKLAEWRSSMKGAPVYLSQFSYESEAAILKKAIHLYYNGTAHLEDLTYLFKANANLGKYERLPHGDNMMKEWMKINPTCTPDYISSWPAVQEGELEPLDPWDGDRDATEDSPACPQKELIYGRITLSQKGMSEDCIYLNVHVPFDQFPQEDDESGFNDTGTVPGLPILVMIHGGGFNSGSGLTDLHGPEYLMAKGVIVTTFNYRINVIGFLSLNSKEVPGNQGLRDQVTLLRWVQRNARSFGGDPENVTLMGQSAGASCAHLLSLSKATEGLFKRAILMSGTAIPNYFTASPRYAKDIADMFLSYLSINSTDPGDIHRQLVQLPLVDIMHANTIVQHNYGLTTFVPVVEDQYPDVTTILDGTPLDLIAKGRGKEYPFLIGFTNKESETFRWINMNFEILRRLEENPKFLLSPRLIYNLPEDRLTSVTKKVNDKCFNETRTLDKFLHYLDYSFFKYPAFKLAQWRSKYAPVYLYQYSYRSERSLIKEALWSVYDGAAHCEDLTYVFRVNSLLGDHVSIPPKNNDDRMKEWMTTMITTFMRCRY
ncbi:Juvenile hormone esterase [Operophtera brumata]|uniref:Juvenile hormone esterase n=1 Tax=Operophtera brumata TaxID=104452 RepID=A0A0L7LFR4_OPEBR|nr:Juvenile hormone esterase [Operophtera brumata]